MEIVMKTNKEKKTLSTFFRLVQLLASREHIGQLDVDR